MYSLIFCRSTFFSNLQKLVPQHVGNMRSDLRYMMRFLCDFQPCLYIKQHNRGVTKMREDAFGSAWICI